MQKINSIFKTARSLTTTIPSTKRFGEITPFSTKQQTPSIPKKFDDKSPSAVVAGNVEFFDNSSIWYGCVVRADVNAIRIGAYTNIQDDTIVREAEGPLNEDHDGSTIIGHYVTIGHKCVLRGCTIEDECLVGMGSVIEEGAYMEYQSMLGGGSVLTKNTRIPSGELWLGNPAKFYRKLSDDEIQYLIQSAQKYAVVADDHKEEFFLPSTLYREAKELGLPIGWRMYPLKV